MSMAHSPYTPPRSEVHDVGPERLLAHRPRSVELAVYLLWIALALSLPTALFEYRRAAADGAGLVLLAFMVPLFALSIVMNLSIGRGRNWARILFLALYLLSVFSFLGALDDMLALPAFEVALDSIVMAMETVALYLLFTRPGALWFRAAH